VVDNATPLDPSSAFELDLKWGRRFGSYPNQVVNVSFPLNYSYHGWRAAWYGLLDTDVSEWEWINAWQTRGLEIAVLLLGLVVLTTGLVMQKRLSASARQLKGLRTAYLVFTLGFIGWYAQGQLTIVNITAALDELRHGGDLLFFMNDRDTLGVRGGHIAGVGAGHFLRLVVSVWRIARTHQHGDASSGPASSPFENRAG
jgi:hypothetical protein